MNIYQKLIEVRKSVPYLQKDNKGHQFNYVSSSQALGTVRGKMDEMGLLLIPSVLENDVLDHVTKSGNHEYFTKVVVKFTWLNAEKPEETVECMWIGQGLDSGEKGVGKALTYAEKYFLLKFFNVATDKDDPDSFKDKFKEPEIITEEQAKQIKSMIAETDSSIDKMLALFQIESVEEMNSTHFKKAHAILSAKKKVKK